jgi:hypothetical protein
VCTLLLSRKNTHTPFLARRCFLCSFFQFTPPASNSTTMSSHVSAAVSPTASAPDAVSPTASAPDAMFPTTPAPAAVSEELPSREDVKKALVIMTRYSLMAGITAGQTASAGTTAGQAASAQELQAQLKEIISHVTDLIVDDLQAAYKQGFLDGVKRCEDIAAIVAPHDNPLSEASLEHRPVTTFPLSPFATPSKRKSGDISSESP